MPVFNQVLDQGTLACRVMSALSGDYGAERRSACIAYRDSSFKLVEQCRPLPATQPYVSFSSFFSRFSFQRCVRLTLHLLVCRQFLDCLTHRGKISHFIQRFFLLA